MKRFRVMAAALWFGIGSESTWFAFSLLERVMRLTLLVVLGAAIYFVTLWILGFRIRDFKRRAA